VTPEDGPGPRASSSACAGRPPGWRARLVRALALACSHQRQYITAMRLDRPPRVGDPPPSAELRVTCLVVDSLERFWAVAADVPPTFRDSAEALARRIAQGCVLFLARRRRDDHRGYDIIGYELAERGVFSALGRRHPVPDDVVFSHYCEVLPGWRGRGVHRLLFAARDTYFRVRGGRVVCGVVAPQNHASLRALHRAGHEVVGRVTRLSLAGGRLVWDTPWYRIDDALRTVGVGGRRVWWWVAIASGTFDSGPENLQRRW
jgi:L-amino acid N-acyltransferase YncA